MMRSGIKSTADHLPKWKPGQSGNPKGRIPGSKTIKGELYYKTRYKRLGGEKGEIEFMKKHPEAQLKFYADFRRYNAPPPAAPLDVKMDANFVVEIVKFGKEKGNCPDNKASK